MEDAWLPASSFNRIKLFEHQAPVSRAALQELADVFVKEGVHNDWGIGLLHRHRGMPERHVMVHERSLDGIDICRPRNFDELSKAALVGSAFHLNLDNKLQAYEYDTNARRRLLAPESVQRFRELLHMRSLGDSIAIVANPEPGSDFVLETLITDTNGDVEGMMTVPDDQRTDEDATNWMVRVGHQHAEIITVKRCKNLLGGLHEVVRDGSEKDISACRLAEDDGVCGQGTTTTASCQSRE